MEALRLLLVYGASCAAVLWLVHRFLRPVPRPVAAVLVLLPLTFTGRAMLTGGSWGGLNLAYNTPPLAAQADLLPDAEGLDGYQNGILMDHVCQVIPWRKAVRESVKHGHWPLWNRFSRGGDILLGASQPAPFDPKVWLGFLLPLATAMTFAGAFVFFQAATFGWLYLRELGVADWAALVGGALYMGSGFLTFWVGWSMSSVWAVLPLLLLGVHRMVHAVERREALSGVGASTAAWTLALVGGHPESVVHLATASGLVLAAEAGLDGSRWRRAVPRALLGGLLAGALAAPALFPFVEAMRQTSDYQHRSGVDLPHSVPFDQAVRSAGGAVYPWAWGRPHSKGPFRPARIDEAAGAYIGGAGLTLALLGLVSARRRRWTFAGIGGFAFAMCVGMPVVADLVGALPLFSITLNERLAGLAAFCLAVLAAFGADELLSDDANPSRRLWIPAVGATGLLLVGGLVRWATFDDGSSWRDGFAASLPWLIVPAMAVAAVAFFSPRGRAHGVITAAALLALVLVPRAAESPDFYRVFPTSAFYPPLEELAALPDFQRAGSGRAGRGGHVEPYRVVGLYRDLVPAQSALWELEDPRGFQVMRFARQNQTLDLWCIRSSWFCRVEDTSKPFLSALNVRFALGAPDLKQAGDWRLLIRGENLSLWENPRVLPRAWVPARLRRVDPKPFGDPRTPAEMSRLDDFAEGSWIEIAEWPDGGPPVQPNGRATVRTFADGPDLVLEVDAEDAAWIVVSETAWSGWRATDQDGRRLPLHFANHTMLGFRVEPGTHDIRLAYRPRSFTVGLSLSASTWLVLGLFWLRGRLRGPRRATDD